MIRFNAFFATIGKALHLIIANHFLQKTYGHRRLPVSRACTVDALNRAYSQVYTNTASLKDRLLTACLYASRSHGRG